MKTPKNINTWKLFKKKAGTKSTINRASKQNFTEDVVVAHDINMGTLRPLNKS